MNSLPMKCLRNFLVANLCALVPLWVVAFGWMPVQVKVEARGTKPVALIADGMVLQGEEHGTWEEGTVWRFYLREGMEWKDLAFRLPEGMDGADVGWVRLEKWKLMSLGKSGEGLKQRDGETNIYGFENSRFERLGLPQGKISFGLAGIEVVLLSLSWWFAKRHREERWKTLWPSVLSAAFVLALLMQVALPLQSYVANRSAFPFTPGELGGAIAVRSGVMLALSGLALGLLARCFGRWILAFVLAFTACAYLESGVLSIGLPSLNGNWSFFENTTRALWDGAIWGGIFLLTALTHRWVKRWYGVAGLCLAALIGLSLFDVHPEPQPDSSKWIVDEFSPKDVVARSVVYAPTNDVLVFVIDSLECAQAHAIMEDPDAGPRLREQFRGFTEYTNNIGTGDYSAVAVANLLTGKYPECATGMADYYNSVFSEESVLKDYMDAGHGVFMVTEDKHFTNRRKALVARESLLPVMERRVLAGQPWTLPGIDRFRWMPFAIKLRYLRLSCLMLPGGEFSREWELYPGLGKAKIDSGERGAFLFVHTDGTHLPVLYNRDGEQMPQADNSDSGCVEMGIHILRQLGKLLDLYREKGIYDNSMIVVLADHGHHDNVGVNSESFGPNEILSSNARPFLWVKPVGSDHEFLTSALPTTHANVAAVLREACRQPLSESEIQHILYSEKRLYRRVLLLDGTIMDWAVDSRGEVVSKEILREQFSRQTTPLALGQTYNFNVKNWDSNRDKFHFTGMHCNEQYPVFHPDYPQMDLSFRVSGTAKSYNLRLGLTLWRYRGRKSDMDTRMLFSQDGLDTQWEVVRGEGSAEHLEVSLVGLVPDEEGNIRIVGRRGEGFESFVVFHNSRLEEHVDSPSNRKNP